MEANFIPETNYSEIPDTLKTKQFLPLAHNMWPIIRKYGWDYSHDAMNKVFKNYYNIAKVRLDEAIFTARDLLGNGKIQRPDRVLTYFFFPVVFCIRNDLQAGTTKLLFGESTDTTFILLDDFSEGTIGLMFNCHMEDGVPVDWWLIDEENQGEVLERRHLKLGMKLKDLPARISPLYKSGERVIEVLKDIRNERTPQWSHSTYHVCLCWMSEACNLGVEINNHESFAGTFDALTAKPRWHLFDNYVSLVPWPPLIPTFLNLGRAAFTMRLAGLFCEDYLYLQGIGDYWINWMKQDIPEIYEITMKQRLEKEGVQYPIQTIKCELPDLLNKRIYEESEFTWKYPDGRRIFAEDLGYSVEETLQGVYLDITHETPPTESVTPENILSYGIGRSTKVFK
ncbi:MAG TPA: hypothetical protein VMV49_14685 [Candidatus Deferrimicrobium sp.]|nr:hypothetical protein [Candidatus Deferrimicrobium sp.]